MVVFPSQSYTPLRWVTACVTVLWSRAWFALDLELTQTRLKWVQLCIWVRARPDFAYQIWLVLTNCSWSCSTWCNNSFRPVAAQRLWAAPVVCATSDAKWRSEINEQWTTYRSCLQSRPNCVKFCWSSAVFSVFLFALVQRSLWAVWVLDPGSEDILGKGGPFSRSWLWDGFMRPNVLKE